MCHYQIRQCDTGVYPVPHVSRNRGTRTPRTDTRDVKHMLLTQTVGVLGWRRNDQAIKGCFTNTRGLCPSQQLAEENRVYNLHKHVTIKLKKLKVRCMCRGIFQWRNL